MIKRLVVLFLFCIYSPVALADVWEDVVNCLEDPCNCGASERIETWDGVDVSAPANRLCPPWNKSVGRYGGTCLLKQTYPGKFIGYYENLCAEKTAESTYFNPKIRVRGQQCNVFTCWTTKHTLDWEGECITLGSGYGLPLHRMCARVAMPADPARDFAQDPGYTSKEHLNFEGATEDDEVIIDKYGEVVEHEAPKLCVYKDPSAFSFEGGIDIMDLDPIKQPFHKTEQTHPIIEVVIFFFRIAEGAVMLPSTLLSEFFGLFDAGEGNTPVASVMRDLFAFIGEIIATLGERFIGLLKEWGSLNNAVDDTVYGCVNLPLGPFPPPFCKTLQVFEEAKIQKICHIGEDGYTVNSNEGNECVVSSLRNNFIHNSVRISYDRLIPLCRDGENSMLTDKCVVLDNLGLFSSPQTLHELTENMDIVKHCSDSDGAICVNSQLPHSCSVSENGCQDGIRIVYGTNVGGRLHHQEYFRDDLDDCPSSTSATCQEIWGVNMGEFVDIKLEFPAIETSYARTHLVKRGIKLSDKAGREADFYASIVRIHEIRENEVYTFMQETNQICVYEGEYLVGCQRRAPHSRPLLYDCADSEIPGLKCASSYFDPKFIASHEVIYKDEAGIEFKDTTSAMIEPKTIYNNGITENDLINLAGDDFSSFVTDDTFVTMPFSGDNSPTFSSLFGTYRDDVLPISSGKAGANAIYLYGLEYINEKYYLGGTLSCLQSTSLEKCPVNSKMCVLTKLLNNDIVKCSEFYQKSEQYPGLGLCKTNGCDSVDWMAKIGGGRIHIRQCDPISKCYDAEVELCVPSNLVADRVDPKPELGTKLADSEYYDVSVESEFSGAPSGIFADYDQDEYALRDKTSVEMGLCSAIPIPTPTCSAQTDYSEENGFASWPETELGEIAEGTCQDGWEPVEELKRYCVPFPETRSFGLESLARTAPGALGVVETTYTDVKCQEIPPKE